MANTRGRRFVNKVTNLAKRANNYAKKTQIISKTLSNIDNPVVQAIAQGAAAMGYGYGVRAGSKRSKKKTSRRKRTYVFKEMK